MFSQIPSELRKYEWQTIAPQRRIEPDKPNLAMRPPSYQYIFPHPSAVIQPGQRYVIGALPEVQHARILGVRNPQIESITTQSVREPQSNNRDSQLVSTGLPILSNKDIAKRKASAPQATTTPRNATQSFPRTGMVGDIESSPIRELKDDQEMMKPDVRVGVVETESQIKYFRQRPIFELEAAIEEKKKQNTVVDRPLKRSPLRRPLFEVAQKTGIEQGDSTVGNGIFLKKEVKDKAVETTSQKPIELEEPFSSKQFPTPSGGKSSLVEQLMLRRAKNERLKTPNKIFDQAYSSTKSAEIIPQKPQTPFKPNHPSPSVQPIKPRSPVQPVSLKPVYNSAGVPVGPSNLSSFAPTKQLQKECKPAAKPANRLDPATYIVIALPITALVWLLLSIYDLLAA